MPCASTSPSPSPISCSRVCSRARARLVPRGTRLLRGRHPCCVGLDNDGGLQGLQKQQQTRVLSPLRRVRAFSSSSSSSGVGKSHAEDGPFARFMLWLFTNKMADSLQIEKKFSINEPPSYDDFVDTSFAAMARAGPKEQSQASLDIMLSMLPPDGPAVFRKLFPVAKWSCELNAAITKWVFAWMVGPMTLEERDVPNEWSGEGSTRMKSVVVIEKCRYLEESGCTGMCVNLCKASTQTFFNDHFGLPLTVKPNHEDMSCEFIFGQEPPPLEQDEALLFPCRVDCKTARNCSGADGSDGASLPPCHKLPASNL